MRAGAIRPRLVAVWGLLVVLAGAIAVHEGTELFDAPPPAPTGRLPVFAFTEPELGAVEAIYQGRTGSLMRDPAGRWFVHSASHTHSAAAEGGAAPAAPNDTHQADPETAAKIAETLAVTARTLADRRVRPVGGLAEYGLANPQTMIAFYGRGPDGADYSAPLEVLYVGELLPDEFAFYTMRDGDEELSLIPRYFIALLLAAIYGEDQAPTMTPERAGTPTSEAAPDGPGDRRRF